MSKSVPDNLMHARYRKVRVNGKQMSLHRHVMELKLGRSLLPHEVVHHINGNKLDNRPENLMVMDSAEHLRLERKEFVFTEAVKRKISLSLIGNQRRKGIPHTQEIKNIIGRKSREARKRKFWSTRKKSA